MIVTLRDGYSGTEYRVVDPKCECCGRRHQAGYLPFSRRHERLLLDHTWREDGSYSLTILCFRCNTKKMSFPYVSLGPDRCWYPGQPPNTWMPKPIGPLNRLAIQNCYGQIIIGRRSAGRRAWL